MNPQLHHLLIALAMADNVPPYEADDEEELVAQLSDMTLLGVIYRVVNLEDELGINFKDDLVGDVYDHPEMLVRLTLDGEIPMKKRF